MTNSNIDDFRPSANWSMLRLRAEMLRRVRQFFDSRGFLEIETPILSADTVVDRHLDPFCVNRGGDCEAASGYPPTPALWLQTSPEFHMKRMLAAGSGPIYQVARVFRQGELGPLHNPEFTMIEWYQPGVEMDDGMQLTADLCEELLGHVKPRPVVAPGCATDGRGFISYGNAFERYVGVDPHTADIKALIETTKTLGIEAPESLSTDDRDGWLDLLMVERVQPNLGVDRPTLLFDYPASQAALAQIRRDEGKPPVAERFELFVAGIELANGYHELLDADELRKRNSRVNAQRVADGKASLPEESRLLAAMGSGLPPSVGVALGFDRLLMIAAGAKTIAEVMAFPFDQA